MRTGYRINAVRALGALVVSGLLVAGAFPESPVADAAMRGDLETVRALLDAGQDVNAAQGDGMTALHWAGERGDQALAKTLIEAGANVAVRTRIGAYTPLHLASRAGSAPVTQMLVEAGAEVSAATEPGLATPLHLAALGGDAATIEALVVGGADLDAREAEWGQTPLIFAASRNRAGAIRTLLAAGANSTLTTQVQDPTRSALDRAASQRRSAVLASLTDSGKVEATPAQIQEAIAAGREVYETGVEGEAPEDPPEEDDEEEPRGPTAGPGGLTALLHAVREGYSEATVALLDGGADIEQASDADGTTPLLMATINGQFDIAVLLLDRGADPNKADQLNGVAPLWAAINSQWQPRTRFPQPQEHSFQENTYLDLMQALLEAGADPDHRTDRHPFYMVFSGCGNGNCGLEDTRTSTAFWRAAYGTDVEAMRLLVAYGADPNLPTLTPLNNNSGGRGGGARGGRGGRGGQQQQAQAGRGGQQQQAQAGRGGQQTVQQAAQAGQQQAGQQQTAEPARPAGAGGPGGRFGGREDLSGLPPVPPGGPVAFPIHAAAGIGYGEGFAGNSHRHRPDGWLASVRYLVEELGTDVNERDNNGYSPLHHAAARGDNELILYLISKGADPTVVSRRGQTVADMANGPVSRISPIPSTIVLLEKLGSRNNHRCASC